MEIKLISIYWHGALVFIGLPHVKHRIKFHLNRGEYLEKYNAER